MGKASRTRSARQAVAEIKREQEKAALAAKKKKTLYSSIIAAVSLLLCAVFVFGVVFFANANKNGTFLRQKVAMKSDNYEVSGTTFSYFFNFQYGEFINQNADNLTYMGLDYTSDLKQQEYSEDMSWFDYIADMTEDNLTEILMLAEKAKADGVSLGEEEQKQIDDFFAQLEEDAKTNDCELEEYIHLSYGEGVNVDDIRKGLEISTLATKYYTEKIDSLTYTDKEIQEYYEANSVDFNKVDYRYYNFIPNVTEDMDEKEAQAEYDKVEERANRLAKAKTPEEFDDILSAILKEDGTTDTNIETYLQNAVLEGNTYDAEFDVSVWAYDAERKVNDTKIYVNGTKQGVYMITRLPYRNESETRSVRHILVSFDSYETDSEAYEKATEILDEYNKGDKTSESFAALAEKYTEDPGSQTTGGLYENFAEGEMVEPFEEWSFDKTRKKGDTDIVKTDYGYHIMYFESKGDAAWKGEVTTTLKNVAYDKLYTEIEKTYKVEKDEKVINDVPVIRFVSSES